MTPDEFKKRMEACAAKCDEGPSGPYDAHTEADDLMCKVLTELGYGDGVSIFQAMERWYE